MPRKFDKIEIVSRENWEDEMYSYEKCIFNTGVTAVNKYPKKPKESREQIFEKLGPMLLDMYEKAMYNRTKKELKRG